MQSVVQSGDERCSLAETGLNCEALGSQAWIVASGKWKYSESTTQNDFWMRLVGEPEPRSELSGCIPKLACRPSYPCKQKTTMLAELVDWRRWIRIRGVRSCVGV